MFCRKCGEENPENAVFCRKCGERLEKEVKKAEVIDTPINNNQYRNTNESTTTSSSSSKSDSMGWIACCCIGIFVIFIISALFSGF